jgi:hypothetical protein
MNSALFSEQLEQALTKTQNSSSRGVEQILNRKLEKNEIVSDFSGFWNLSAHRLANVQQVIQASSETQHQILHDLARDRFLEAYGIEKAGMSFAAKMSLLSESLNEQKLYSLFAAEEALHFNFIQSVLGEQTPHSGDPFIQFLHAVIISAERRPLLFIIQVVLEGWGLDHYAGMLKTCQNEPLKAPLQRILLDEAGHHGCGLSLFDESQLSEAELAYTLEMMGNFLDMVRIGPVGLLQNLDHNLGGLTTTQKQTILTEMGAIEDTQRKLTLLKALMQKAQAHRILAALEARESFALLF